MIMRNQTWRFNKNLYACFLSYSIQITNPITFLQRQSTLIICKKLAFSSNISPPTISFNRIKKLWTSFLRLTFKTTRLLKGGRGEIYEALPCILRRASPLSFNPVWSQITSQMWNHWVQEGLVVWTGHRVTGSLWPIRDNPLESARGTLFPSAPVITAGQVVSPCPASQRDVCRGAGRCLCAINCRSAEEEAQKAGFHG